MLYDPVLCLHGSLQEAWPARREYVLAIRAILHLSSSCFIVKSVKLSLTHTMSAGRELAVAWKPTPETGWTSDLPTNSGSQPEL